MQGCGKKKVFLDIMSVQWHFSVISFLCLLLSGQIEADGREAWVDAESNNLIKHLVVSRFCLLEIEQPKP